MEICLRITDLYSLRLVTLDCNITCLLESTGSKVRGWRGFTFLAHTLSFIQNGRVRSIDYDMLRVDIKIVFDQRTR